ncbi:MAG: hypothetical protein LBJ12_00910 [Oscillospiraceae bacterium]|nr:hypothetical protein [Oscillospiraceae bacterium]
MKTNGQAIPLVRITVNTQAEDLSVINTEAENPADVFDENASSDIMPICYIYVTLDDKD